MHLPKPPSFDAFFAVFAKCKYFIIIFWVCALAPSLYFAPKLMGATVCVIYIFI